MGSGFKRLSPSKARKSVLAFGEGATEKAILKYFQSVYDFRDIAVTVRGAHGSTPLVIVQEAIKEMSVEYDVAFVLMDTDGKPWATKIETLAKSKKLLLIPATPCVEGLLLSIFDSSTDYSTWSSGKCKKKFHKVLLSKSQKLDYKSYARHFPKRVLELKRKKFPSLDKIIKLLSGG